MATYYVELQNAFGTPIARFDQMLELTYSRTVNEISWMRLVLPPTVDLGLFGLDYRFLIYRNSRLEMNTEWLIRVKGSELTSQGKDLIVIPAVSFNEVLSRRIVAYNAGSAQASKTSQADNMMKTIIYENLGAGAVAKRNISTYLGIEPNLTLAPIVTKAFARRNVFTVLRELAELSAKQGTALFFDLMPLAPARWEFRTFIGQRGSNRSSTSANPLLLSPEMGTITNGEVTDDYSAEVNDVYAAGDGEGADRMVEEVDDPVRIGASPINRREKLKDAQNGVTAAQLQDEARTALYEGRARRYFTADIQQTEAVQYGRDWFWGDLVGAQFLGLTFDCLISTVQVKFKNGKEDVRAKLVSESVL